MTSILIKMGDLDTETVTDTHRGKTIWRDMGRRRPHTSQGDRPGADPFLTDRGRNPPCRHPDLKTSSLQNCEPINPCRLSHRVCGTLSQQPQEANTVAKSMFRVNSILFWSLVFTILYLSDTELVNVTSLCFSLLLWSGESGTNLMGTLWQLIMNERCLKRAGQEVRLSKWRRWEKAADRWQQWLWGLVRPPSHLLAIPCFSPVSSTDHSLLVLSALPFLGAHSDFLTLALSCSPFASCWAPSHLPSSLSKAVVLVTPSSARCSPCLWIFLSLVALLPLTPGEHRQAAFLLLALHMSPQMLVSTLLPLTGLGTNFLLPHVCNPAHCPRALMSG